MAKYSTTFTYNIKTSLDASGLTKLKAELRETELELVRIGQHNLLPKQEVDKAIQSVQKINDALTRAFNPKLGTLNLTTFKKDLAGLGVSSKGIAADFEKAGTTGKMAFNDMLGTIGKIDTSAKSVSRTTDKIANTLGNTIRWGLIASVFQTVLNSLHRSVDYLKELDKSLTNIRLVSDYSKEDMREFALYANDAAKALGSTTVGFTDASLIYAQQGYGISDQKSLASTTIKAANATGQETGEVSEQMTSLINGYQLKVDEVSGAMDKLAIVANVSAADMEELATAQAKVASTAHTLGVSQDQLVSQIGTVVSVTREAPENVGNALKTIYARLGDLQMNGSTDDGVTLGSLSQTLKSVGVQVMGEDGSMRSMGDIMEDLMGQWGNFDTGTKQALAIKLAGKYQYNRLMALLENQEKYEEYKTASETGEGTLDEMQAEYLDSVEGKTNQMKASFEGLISSLFDPNTMIPFIESLTEVLELLESFGQSIGGIDSLMLGLGSTATRVFSKNIAQSISHNLSNKEQRRAREESSEEILRRLGVDKKYTDDPSVQALIELAHQRDIFAHIGSTEQQETFNNVQQDMVSAVNQKIKHSENSKIFDFATQAMMVQAGLAEGNEIGNSTSFRVNRDNLGQLDVVNLTRHMIDDLAFSKTTEGESGKELNRNLVDALYSVRDTWSNTIGTPEFFQKLNQHPDQLTKEDLALIRGNGGISQGKDVFMTGQELQEFNNDLDAGGERARKALEQLAHYIDMVFKSSRIASEGDGTIGWYHTPEEARQREAEHSQNAARVDAAIIEKNLMVEEAATLRLANAFSQLTSGVLSLGYAWQSFQALGSIFSNEDISMGEKALQIFMNLASTLGTLIPTMNELRRTLRSGSYQGDEWIPNWKTITQNANSFRHLKDKVDNKRNNASLNRMNEIFSDEDAEKSFSAEEIEKKLGQKPDSMKGKLDYAVEQGLLQQDEDGKYRQILPPKEKAEAPQGKKGIPQEKTEIPQAEIPEGREDFSRFTSKTYNTKKNGPWNYTKFSPASGEYKILDAFSTTGKTEFSEKELAKHLGITTEELNSKSSGLKHLTKGSSNKYDKILKIYEKEGEKYIAILQREIDEVVKEKIKAEVENSKSPITQQSTIPNGSEINLQNNDPLKGSSSSRLPGTSKLSDDDIFKYQERKKSDFNSIITQGTFASPGIERKDNDKFYGSEFRPSSPIITPQPTPLPEPPVPDLPEKNPHIPSRREKIFGKAQGWFETKGLEKVSKGIGGVGKALDVVKTGAAGLGSFLAGPWGMVAGAVGMAAAAIYGYIKAQKQAKIDAFNKSIEESQEKLSGLQDVGTTYKEVYEKYKKGEATTEEVRAAGASLVETLDDQTSAAYLAAEAWDKLAESVTDATEAELNNVIANAKGVMAENEQKAQLATKSKVGVVFQGEQGGFAAQAKIGGANQVLAGEDLDKVYISKNGEFQVANQEVTASEAIEQAKTMRSRIGNLSTDEIEEIGGEEVQQQILASINKYLSSIPEGYEESVQQIEDATIEKIKLNDDFAPTDSETVEEYDTRVRKEIAEETGISAEDVTDEMVDAASESYRAENSESDFAKNYGKNKYVDTLYGITSKIDAEKAAATIAKSDTESSKGYVIDTYSNTRTAEVESEVDAEKLTPYTTQMEALVKIMSPGEAQELADALNYLSAENPEAIADMLKNIFIEGSNTEQQKENAVIQVEKYQKEADTFDDDFATSPNAVIAEHGYSDEYNDGYYETAMGRSDWATDAKAAQEEAEKNLGEIESGEAYKKAQNELEKAKTTANAETIEAAEKKVASFEGDAAISHAQQDIEDMNALMEHLSETTFLLEKGAKGVCENFSDSVAVLEDADAPLGEWEDSLQKINTSMEEAFNIDASDLGDTAEEQAQFYIDNADLIKDAFGGSLEAAIKLEEAVQDKIAETMLEAGKIGDIEIDTKLDNTNFMNQLQSVQDQVAAAGTDIEIGTVIKAEGQFEDLFTQLEELKGILRQAGLSETEAGVIIEKILGFKTENGVNGKTYVKSKGSASNIASAGEGAGGIQGEEESYEPKEIEVMEKEDVNRYEKVDAVLEHLAKTLERVGQEEDRLIGTRWLDNIEAQTDQYQKQIGLLKQKLQLQKQEASELRNELSSEYGVSFDSEGFGANYADVFNQLQDNIINLQNEYNNMTTEEAQDAQQEKIDAAQDKFDKFKEDYDRYSQLWSQDIQGTLNEIAETENRLEDLAISIFEQSVEAAEELQNIQENYNEFTHSLKTLEKDSALADLNLALENMGDKIQSDNALLDDMIRHYQNLKKHTKDASMKEWYDDQIKAFQNAKKNSSGAFGMLQSQMDTLLEQYHQWERTGTSSIFGKNERALFENMQALFERATAYMEGLKSSIREVVDAIIAYKDEIVDMFSEIEEGFAQNLQSLDHAESIIDMTKGENAYEEKLSINKAKGETLTSQWEMKESEIQNLKNMQSQLEKGSEEWKAVTQEIAKQEQESLDIQEQLLQVRKEQYDLTVQQKVDDWKNSQIDTSTQFKDANGNIKTTDMPLDYFVEQWERINKNAELYLDTVNRSFETQKLQNKYLEMLDKTNDLNTQKRITDQMNEQLGYLRDKTELSEYDVKYANAQLEILQKRIALEEAERNKSQMKLRRDTQGNFSYVYAGDQDDIASKKADLLDAENNAYNLTKDANLKAQGDALSGIQQYGDQYNSIMNDMNLTEDQRQAALQNLGASFSEFMAAQSEIVKQTNLNVVQDFIGSANAMNEENAAIMNEIITAHGDNLGQHLDLIDERFASSISNWLGENGLEGFTEKTNELNEELTETWNIFFDNISTKSKITGKKLNDFGGILTDCTKKNKNLNSQIRDVNKTIASQRKEFQKDVQQLNNYKKTLDRLKKPFQDFTNKVRQMNKALESQRRILADINAERDAGSSPTSKIKGSKKNGKSSNGKTGKNAGGSNSGGGGPTTTTTPSKKLTPWQRFLNWGSTKYSFVPSIPTNDSSETRTDNNGRGYFRKDKGHLFDTGGYTGAWSGSGNANARDGKLAWLHQKELVLNAADTANILAAVKGVRGISEGFRANFASSGIKGTTASPSNTIEQRVSIEATFPNVKDARDVEQALLGLADKSYQYAYRR